MEIAPSILDADFSRLQEELDSIASADWIHLDIMDGHYVPNLSFGLPVLKGLAFTPPLEAHLMVNNPENFFPMFVELGCKTILFHIENTGRTKAKALLKHLKSKSILAGITIDGYTEPDFLDEELLNLADQILVMSVKAGFGGQSFLPQALEKIKTLRKRGFKGIIEVDGGVNLSNAPSIKAAGADRVVVGSFLLSKPPKEREGLIQAFQAL